MDLGFGGLTGCRSLNVWCILGPSFKSIIVFRGIGHVVVNLDPPSPSAAQWSSPPWLVSPTPTVVSGPSSRCSGVLCLSNPTPHPVQWVSVQFPYPEGQAFVLQIQPLLHPQSLWKDFLWWKNWVVVLSNLCHQVSSVLQVQREKSTRFMFSRLWKFWAHSSLYIWSSNRFSGQL